MVMPNYKTHDVVGVVATLVALGVVGPFEGAWMFFLASLFGTFFFSPDLDTNSRIVRRWGPLQFIWIPYRVFVRHRSWLSHSGVSALIRVGYIISVVWLGSLLLGLRPEVEILQGQLGPILAGLVFADLVHVITDWVA
jgi:uncharacterized metal-binding protein